MTCMFSERWLLSCRFPRCLLIKPYIEGGVFDEFDNSSILVDERGSAESRRIEGTIYHIFSGNLQFQMVHTVCYVRQIGQLPSLWICFPCIEFHFLANIFGPLRVITPICDPNLAGLYPTFTFLRIIGGNSDVGELSHSCSLL